MNTNDFYKELFEKYALNEDKIRRNAIKEAKTPAWRRTLGAHWKTFAGAAAAVAVTVGAVAYTTARSGDGGIDIVSHEDVLSASQRLQEVERNYYNVSSAENESGSDIYVSFARNVCYNDISVSLSAVSDNEDIFVCRLYLEGDTVIDGAKDIAAFAETGRDDMRIIGAKLYAPAKYYQDIQNLSIVYVAEFGSAKLNDHTFTPLRYVDGDPLASNYDFVNTTAVTPSVTTTPFEFVSETAVPTAEAETTTADSDADTTEPLDTDISDGTEDTSQEDERDPADGTETSDDAAGTEPGITTADSSTNTVSDTTVTVSSEEITDAPDIGLISQIYQLNVENAVETILVGDHAIVLGRGNAYFYHLGGMGSIPRAKSAELSSPKVVYSDENTIILSGCGTSGLRNVLAIYDMKSDRLYYSDASANLGSAEIGIVQYSSTEGRFFMKTVSAANTYFYEITVNAEEGIQFRPLFEYSGTVSAAGFRNGILWFTAAEDSINYSLYSFNCANGECQKVKELGASCKIRRSLTFESFLVISDDSATGEAVVKIFNIDNGKFIPVDVNSDVQIAVSGNTIYVRNDGKTYSVASDGVLTESGVKAEFTAAMPESRYVVTYSGSDRIEVAEKNPNSWN